MAHVEVDAHPLRGQVELRERVDRQTVRRDPAEIANDRPHRRDRRNAKQKLIVAMSFGRQSGLTPDPNRKETPTDDDGRKQTLDRPLRALPRLADDRAGHDDRERRAALDQERSRLLRDVARVGRERLSAHVRRLPPARRAGRRPARPPAALPGREHPLHPGLARRRHPLRQGGARAVQGIGGAVASAVSLSLMMTLFTEPAERAKAMGVFGFVAAGGGSIGVVLGGVLTDFLNWHWIFLVNVPIGALVVFLSLRLLPGTPGTAKGKRIDLAGAATITGALMLAIYAIVNGNQEGWTSAQTLGLLGGAVALLGAFLWLESHVRTPLVPLRLFRLRNFSTANVVGVLWAAAMFAWFFLAALYLQFVLGYSPLQIGLAFLPSSLIMAVFSIGLSARLVMRFGISRTLATGLALATAGLALFIRLPVDGSFLVDVLPSMILLGFGAGMAFNPVLLAAMNDVEQTEAGLASGVVKTAVLMGGGPRPSVLPRNAAPRTHNPRPGGGGAGPPP